MFPALAVFLALPPSHTFVVCLDPGHPSENGIGAVGTKLREVELVWDLTKRVQAELKGVPGLRIFLTKHALDQKVTNRARAAIANAAHADLFLRIHADSGPKSGFATYFPAGQARVQGVLGPPTSILTVSKEDALEFHQTVVADLHGALPDLGCLSETHTLIGHRQGALTGTVFSRVPVFLVEVCSVDNRHDAAFASSQTGRKHLARAIAAGIQAVRRLERSTSSPSRNDRVDR